MPAMNGLEFYREAVKEDARIGGNFLFCSGEITADRERFLAENDLPYLRKPFSVNDFMNLIKNVQKKSNLPHKNQSVLLTSLFFDLGNVISWSQISPSC